MKSFAYLIVLIAFVASVQCQNKQDPKITQMNNEQMRQESVRQQGSERQMNKDQNAAGDNMLASTYGGGARPVGGHGYAAPASSFSAGPASSFSAGSSSHFASGPATHFASGPATHFASGPATHFASGPSASFGSVPSASFGSAPSASFGAVSGPSYASVPAPPCPRNYLFSCQPSLTPAPCSQASYGSAGAYSHYVPQYLPAPLPYEY